MKIECKRPRETCDGYCTAKTGDWYREGCKVKSPPGIRPGGGALDYYICTLKPGHNGPHVACNGGDHNLGTWPRSDDDVRYDA